MAKDLFPHMSTRELRRHYGETASWDYRKDQFADALDARGWNWGDDDATDEDPRDAALETQGWSA